MDDHKIRRKHLAWAAPLLSLMLSAPALAADPPKQTGQGGAPGVVALEAVTAQATVQAVDHGARTATLRTEDGREIQVKAPDTVRNFDQVEVGDKVNVEYHEATAISVVKADAATPGTASGSSTAPGAGAPASDGASGTRSVRVAPLGAKPGVVETTTFDITALVENVDYEKREVTVRGPRGNTRTLAVGDEVQNLKDIKQGDHVMLRHTEAIAVSVTK
jgi:hypothetical protein